MDKQEQHKQRIPSKEEIAKKQKQVNDSKIILKNGNPNVQNKKGII